MSEAYAALSPAPIPALWDLRANPSEMGLRSQAADRMIAPRRTKRPQGETMQLSNTTSVHSHAAASRDQRGDAFWWQGGLYVMKARAADTGGVLGLVEASLYQGFGPPLHVHRREDEAFYVIEGEIRFRRAQEEFVVGPGSWVWGPRDIPHTFKVESEHARALILITPGGFERMFEAGGVPLIHSPEPPVEEYDPEHAVEISKQFGFEVTGPQL
jgi:quercetin dioxygenase-like cupin family protein